MRCANTKKEISTYWLTKELLVSKLNTYSHLIDIENGEEWDEALKLCGDFDIYHTAKYHVLAREMGEGEPYLFLYQNKKKYAALPFLVRSISTVAGLEDCNYYDATSVYGYPGIVTSIKASDIEASSFLSGFRTALKQAFEDLSIVSFFTRTNPLIQTSWLFKGLADVIPLSSTIAIDLSKPEAEHIKNMTKGHRYDIRKAYKIGIIIREDSSFENIDDFIRIYNNTMKRVGSSDYYFFSKDYYLRLRKHLGDSIKLYFALADEEIVSTSMFFITGKIIQYHLSGSPSELFKYNGAKVILDYVRSWGANNGFSWLHLGGGVGSTEDSLFRFKAGFSKVRCPFEVVRMVVDQKAYSAAVEERKQWLCCNSHAWMESSYFPEYRAPYSNLTVSDPLK